MDINTSILWFVSKLCLLSRQKRQIKLNQFAYPFRALKLSSVFKRGLGAKLNRDNIINSTGNSIVHIKNVYFSGDPMSGNV